MLRDQLPVRHIAKTAQMSFGTISSIRRHAGLSAEKEREALVETMRCAARVVAERVLECSEQMSPRDSSIALKKKREAVPSHTAPGKAPLCDALSRRPLGGRVARSVDSTA